MRLTFLSHNKDSKRLILIFAGWSSDIEFYRASVTDGWDLLVCHDYDSIESISEVLRGYSTIYLYAWSLGVAAAEKALKDFCVTRAIAINGSPCPVSDMYGIPAAIYYSTRNNLNERNLAKFRRRMVDSSSEMDKLSAFLTGKDDIENLKLQLDTIAKITSSDKSESDCERPAFKWDRVYISTDDKIFPFSNLSNVWRSHPANPEIITLKRSHYIPLEEIIRNTVPDTATIGKSFEEALSTYNSNSAPQQKIAERLAEKILPAEEGHLSKAIEIGTGTGYFTKKYLQKISPDSIIHVDLYPIPQLNLAGSETYIEADAEQWLSDTNVEPDIILSASAIQWFSDIDTFFSNCSRILKKKNGLLLCSTFGKLNLKELNELRPSPIHYHSVEELRSMLRKYFDIVEIEEDLITERFNSVCELLKHLRDTGVKGGASGHRSLKKITAVLGNSPELTYHPIYIKARFEKK